MNQEKIFEKAKELGQLVATSEIKTRADEANRALSADTEAMDLIGAYNDKREEKMAAFADRQPSAEEAQELNEYLQTEFNKMAENPVIGEYIEANRDMDQVLSQMNRIIESALSGDQGCGGSCSSCSGCH